MNIVGSHSVMQYSGSSDVAPGKCVTDDIGGRSSRRCDSAGPTLQPMAMRAGGTFPGQKPSFWAIKRHARPYKSAIQNQLTMEHAKGV